MKQYLDWYDNEKDFWKDYREIGEYDPRKILFETEECGFCHSKNILFYQPMMISGYGGHWTDFNLIYHPVLCRDCGKITAKTRLKTE